MNEFKMNNLTNSSLPEAGIDNREPDLIMMWFAISCGIIVLNIMALTSLLIHRKSPRVQPLFSQLLFLIISDLYVGISRFLYGLLVQTKSSKNMIICKTLITCYVTSQIVSFLNILGFGIRRYISVRNINRINNKWKPMHKYIQIAINILGAILTVCYLTASFKDNKKKNLELCNAAAVFGENTSRIMTFPLLLSVICALGTSVLCVISIKRLQAVIAVQPVSEMSFNQSQIAVNRKETERQATYTLILVFLALNICSLPTIIAGILMVFGVDLTSRTREIVYNLNACNSMLNPIIYVFGLKAVRTIIFQKCRCHQCQK